MVCISEGDFHEPNFNSAEDIRYGVINSGYLIETIKAYGGYNLENVSEITGVEIATGLH